ncbi:class I SAM-dependent methyltransferase [Desulfosporosinus sp. FKA]|uniref:class I SAM-dependent methyltransferase n=1 Tax=Desulfosporosinus sp. FKA TaxID=1969834 RepID=UPI001556DEB2|nr:class I SAM-dependent methyltransferase [Desulfosporosinus sp. FKA]
MDSQNKPEVAKFFNDRAKDWNSNIRPKNYEIARKMLNKLGVGKGDTVLDIAAGTGILWSFLKERGLKRYVAIDISDKMVEQFVDLYPCADVRCLNFETDVILETQFDYVIIFNSIPHFDNLGSVFRNAYENLNSGGKFSISHSTTREELKEHHRKIGYTTENDPIPSNETLYLLSKEYGFKNIIIENSEYFFFSGIK